MENLHKVSVAILSWNGKHHLEICLEALERQRDPGVAWEVVVLDNGSKDGTAAWLAERHPRVRLVESPVNLGFCAGTNRLMEACDGDAVALLNNDTKPEEGWLAALVDGLRGAPEDVAAVSGCIVDWSGERLDFGRGVMAFDGHAFQLDFRRPLGRAQIPEHGTELPFACGGNLLIRKRSFVAAGGFDESYFAYLEDVDLGWRLWSGGERVTFVPDAVVRHRSSATSDLLGLYNRGFLFERNAFLTAYKNDEDGLWQKMLPAVLLTVTARTQHLMETRNPGGGLLAIDPYAGHIADTAPRNASAAAPAGQIHATRLERWRRYGKRELLGRAFLKLAKTIWPQAPALTPPCLTDEQTVAHLRAHAFILRHLEQAAEARQAVQTRRRRPDADYFARFPAYLVPTYPGDQSLFQDPGFRAWLPPELPLIECSLGEILQMDG